MSARKLIVAFFASTLVSHSPRGAARLFRAMAEGLQRRTDIELVALFDRVPAGGDVDPLAGTFRYVGAAEYFAGEPPPPMFRVRTFGEAHGWRAGMIGVLRFVKRACISMWRRGVVSPFAFGAQLAKKIYRVALPRVLRVALRPINRMLFVRLPNKVRNGAREIMREVYDAYPALRDRSLGSLLFAPGSASQFSNADVVGDLITLDRVDAILNFWWFHTPESNPLIGLYRPASTRVYAWFLDAIPLRVPHWQTGLIPVNEFRRGVQPHLESADEVIAISDSAARDVGEFFPSAAKTISVVSCGVHPEDFEPAPGPAESADLFRRLGLDHSLPVIVCIGLQEPSKNVLYVIKACVELARRRQQKLQLFVIGPTQGFDPERKFGYLMPAIRERLSVVFPGYVDDAVKRKVLATCSMLVYASLWEGFGMPPLEAMAAGAPAVVSDVASLRDVCGEHAHYCDPYDPEDIARAIHGVLEMSPEERAARTAAARAYAAGWTWDRAVDRLADLLHARAAQGPVLPAAKGSTE